MNLIVCILFLLCSVTSIICIIASSVSSFAPYINNLNGRSANFNKTSSRIKENTYSIMEAKNNTVVSFQKYKQELQIKNVSQGISTTVLNYWSTITKLQVDLNFAKNLRQAQPNRKVPMVNDIVVSKQNDSWIIHVIINNGNTYHKSFKYYKSVNVTLHIDNKIYYNLYPVANIYQLRVLKYIVPKMKPSGKLTLYDHTKRIIYKDLPYKSLDKQPKRKVAVCAYISNFNSAAEIKSLLAFYILQKIDNVILYCSMRCNYFQNLLKKEIDIGYVILYEYTWPLTKRYGLLQRSIQGSQINSCYYRHRNYFEYIISQDVDEYIYSELYPYNLYKAITKAYELSPGNFSLPVENILFCYVGGIIYV